MRKRTVGVKAEIRRCAQEGSPSELIAALDSIDGSLAVQYIIELWQASHVVSLEQVRQMIEREHR